MKHLVTAVGLVISLAVLSLGAATAVDTPASSSQDNTMVVTGVINARDGSILILKSDDGKVYKVDADKAVVVLDRLPGNCMSVRVGDKVRVYGNLTLPDQLKASRLHIFLSETEAAATSIPAGAGAGPVDDDDVQLPSVGDSLGSWRSRGLIIAISYSDRTITVATSKGPFVVDTSAATIVDSNRTVSLMNIGEGDAVRIWGDLVGLNKIRADRVEKLRGKSQQESAMPVTRFTAKGVIEYIDYPSFTFRLSTDTGPIRVLVDEGTMINLHSNRKAFQDLKIGQTVKIEGLGALSTGYVATRIIIVGDPGL